MRMNKRGGMGFLTDNLGTVLFVIAVFIALVFVVILVAGPSVYSKLTNMFGFW